MKMDAETFGDLRRNLIAHNNIIVVGQGKGLQQDGPAWRPAHTSDTIYPITTPNTILVQTPKQYGYAVLAREATRWGGKRAWVWDMHHVETVVEEVEGRPTIMGRMGSKFGTGYSRADCYHDSNREDSGA